MNDIFAGAHHQQSGALIEIRSNQAMAEVQARMTLAQARPRDEARSRDKVIQACARPTLANQAVYSFPRGGDLVSGPSIRLAEVLSRAWGNMDCGIREISQTAGMSTGEAFALDLETNTRHSIEFQIAHIRKTRKKTTQLDDPRDIYELFANLGQRRKRACILAIIPGDIVDDAVDECRRTQEAHVELSAEKIRAMLKAFSDSYRVTEEMVRQRIGHDIGALIPSEFLQLRRIFQSLKDGFAKPDQYFDFPSAADDIGEKLRNGAKPQSDIKADIVDAHKAATDEMKSAVTDMLAAIADATTTDKLEKLSDTVDGMDSPDITKAFADRWNALEEARCLS